MTDLERIALYCIDEEIDFHESLLKEDWYKDKGPNDPNILRINYTIGVLQRTKKALETRYKMYDLNPDKTNIIPQEYRPSNFKGSGI